MTLCSYCGNPIAVATNRDAASPPIYHGECWNLMHPPQHPAQPIQSESQDFRDGTEWAMR